MRLVLNKPGVRAMLRSPGVRADLKRRAQAIADAAGGEELGFEADSRIGRNRARATAITRTPTAEYLEATERRLTRSIDAGRR